MDKEVKSGGPAVAPEANPGDGVRQDNFQGYIYVFSKFSGPEREGDKNIPPGGISICFKKYQGN